MTKIRIENLSAFQSKITKLQNKAAKLGLNPLDVTIGKPEKTLICSIANKYAYFVPVTISGESPTIEGYSIVAKLEMMQAGNLISTLSGFDVPLEYRQRYACDHCKQSRNRIYTFLLQAADGSLLQVGRSCLADFLRDKDYADSLISLYSGIDDACKDDEESGLSWREALIPCHLLLTLAACAGRTKGFLSQAAVKNHMEDCGQFCDHGMISTSERVDDHFRGLTDKMFKDCVMSPAQEDEEMATNALNWILSQDSSSQYVYNAQLMASSSEALIPASKAALVVSIVGSYVRSLEKTKEAVDKPSLSHLGTIGQKLTVKAKLVSVKPFQGQYGMTYLCRFVDDTGNIIIWWKSNSEPDSDIDEVITLSGTVKNHDDYKGIPQTVMTRCKIAALV